MNFLSQLKYAELVCIFYPGRIENKITVNRTFANRLIHSFEKLKSYKAGQSHPALSYTHGFLILYSERIQIQIYGCTIIARANNVISVHSDPNRKLERLTVKEISRRHFKRAADYEAISRELYNFQMKEVLNKNLDRKRR